MRVLKNLGLPFADDPSKFPFGNILNETDSVEGTPVVEEVYGDVILNLYKLLQLTGQTPTDTQDNDQTQYQLINALKRFANDLNDKKQVISLSGSDWSVNFDFDLLPDDYVFIGQVTDDYVGGTTYTFSGTGSNQYSFSSDAGFEASDIVICVINQSGVKAYAIASTGAVSGPKSFPQGAPLSFNSTAVTHYLSAANVTTDEPNTYLIQNTIQVHESNLNLLLIDAVIMKGKLITLSFDTSAITYVLNSFNVGDLTSASSVTMNGISFPTGTDNEPYMYCDGEYLYFSNNIGNSANDYDFRKCNFDESTNELSSNSIFSLDNSFQKTTNSIITGNYLYTFAANVLVRHDLTDSSVQSLGSYNTAVGLIFKLNGVSYFASDGVAVPWNI